MVSFEELGFKAGPSSVGLNHRFSTPIRNEGFEALQERCLGLEMEMDGSTQ